MVMVTAVLASVGTAGIPGSGLVMMTIVLNAVNLPLETIGLLAGIDRILNMARVIPNIVGDAENKNLQRHSADLRSASFLLYPNEMQNLTEWKSRISRNETAKSHGIVPVSACGMPLFRLR